MGQPWESSEGWQASGNHPPCPGVPVGPARMIRNSWLLAELSLLALVPGVWGGGAVSLGYRNAAPGG